MKRTACWDDGFVQGSTLAAGTRADQSATLPAIGNDTAAAAGASAPTIVDGAATRAVTTFRVTVTCASGGLASFTSLAAFMRFASFTRVAGGAAR